MKKRNLFLDFALFLVLLASATLATGSLLAAAPGITSLERISTTGTGAQLSGRSRIEDVSQDGRYVLFGSKASEIAPGGVAPSAYQLYWRDNLTGAVECITVNSKGQALAGGYSVGRVSDDGRRVAFMCTDSLVSRDDNGTMDVYWYDRPNNDFHLVSCSSAGVVGNGQALGFDMDGLGQHIVFSSVASNLVEGDDNGAADIFIHSPSGGYTQRLSATGSGDSGNSYSITPVISADGNTVAFVSNASNLVQNDGNDLSDVFVLRPGHALRCASSNKEGYSGNGWSDSFRLSLSANGDYLIYESNATNLVSGVGADANGSTKDVFLYDWTTNTNRIVSRDAAGVQLSSASFALQVSDDGTCVMFSTQAAILPKDVDNCEEAYIRVLETDDIIRVGRTSENPQLAGVVCEAVMDGTGQHVAFEYDGTDLVDGDTNSCKDVYLVTYDRVPAVLPSPTPALVWRCCVPLVSR